MDCVSGSCCYYRKQVFVLTNPLAESFFFHWVLTNSCVIHDCKSNQAMITENQPDNVGSCLSFLCKQLWVMHHLLQEANYSHLQLCVQLKVLRIHKWTTTVSLPKCYELFCCCFFILWGHRKTEPNKKKKKERKGDCTCECLETQWRSTFRTRFVAALLITNSLSPFLWSVGKPGIKSELLKHKLVLYTINILWSFF